MANHLPKWLWLFGVGAKENGLSDKYIYVYLFIYTFVFMKV